MLAAFPLTALTARDRYWWSHWRFLVWGRQTHQQVKFARPLKKQAVDLPHTPVVSIATG